MILIISQALVNLGPCEIWKTRGDNAVHRLSVVEEADDIMHADARAFYDGIAAANAALAGNISVTIYNLAHSEHDYHDAKQNAISPTGCLI